MLTTSELKDRIRNLIAECEIYSTTWDIGDKLLNPVHQPMLILTP